MDARYTRYWLQQLIYDYEMELEFSYLPAKCKLPNKLTYHSCVISLKTLEHV
jgi:hypothetical protein